MKDQIEEAIKNITKKVKVEASSSDALRFSQAVLNLTHALEKLKNVKNM